MGAKELQKIQQEKKPKTLIIKDECRESLTFLIILVHVGLT